MTGAVTFSTGAISFSIGDECSSPDPSGGGAGLVAERTCSDSAETEPDGAAAAVCSPTPLGPSLPVSAPAGGAGCGARDPAAASGRGGAGAAVAVAVAVAVLTGLLTAVSAGVRVPGSAAESPGPVSGTAGCGPSVPSMVLTPAARTEPQTSTIPAAAWRARGAGIDAAGPPAVEDGALRSTAWRREPDRGVTAPVHVISAGTDGPDAGVL